MIAWSPDAHALETSSAAADSGSPVFMPTTLAEKRESLSVGQVVVKTMWSIALGLIPDFAKAAFATVEASSVNSTF